MNVLGAASRSLTSRHRPRPGSRIFAVLICPSALPANRFGPVCLLILGIPTYQSASSAPSNNPQRRAPRRGPDRRPLVACNERNALLRHVVGVADWIFATGVECDGVMSPAHVKRPAHRSPGTQRVVSTLLNPSPLAVWWSSQVVELTISLARGPLMTLVGRCGRS